MSKDKPKYTQMEAYKELYHAVIDLVLNVEQRATFREWYPEMDS